MPMRHWRVGTLPTFWAQAACAVHPAACVRSTGELFADLEGQPRARRATVSVNHLTYRRTFPLRSVAPRLQNRVPLSTLAVTGRSPTFAPRHHAQCGYQRSHGLQASSGPGESYCGPAVVRIDCVSRQQSLDDADPISGTPGQKCAFRPLGVRPGVHTAVLTSKRSQTGAAMFHVKQNARLAVRAPRTAMVALKTRRRTPAVRFY